MAARPTAPAAPTIKTVSPALTSPATTRVDHAVTNGTPTVAAASMDSDRGFSESHASGRDTNCAWAPSLVTPKPAPLPQTDFPSQRCDPLTTFPAKSLPGVRGRVGLNAPATIFTSLGLIAAADTSTSASSGPRSGKVNVLTSNVEGGP